MKTTSILLCSAFILGLLMPFGFAPYNLWFLPSIILSIFLGIFFQTNAYQGKYFSFFYGLSFGFGFFTHGISWISISLSQFGGAPIIFAAFATFWVIFAMALYYAFFMHALSHSAKISILFSLTLAAPLWILFEWLRSILLTGFPWLALGYSLVDSPFKMLFLPQMGALLSSFWIMWLAIILLSIVLICISYSSKKCKSYKNTSAYLLIISPAFIIAFVMSILYLQSDQIITHQPFKAAIVQGNVAIELKFAEEKFWENTTSYINLSEEILEQHQEKIDLIVWPETAVATFYNENFELFERLRAWTQDYNTHLLTGVATGDLEQGDYRNSVVHLGNQYDTFYDKHRLLPFGEYLPIRWLFSFFRDFVEIPLDDFTAGAEIQEPFDIKGTKVSASICFEGVFGAGIRYQAQHANILVNISNDAWFGNSLAPYQHFQIIKARAIELARPIIRATNTGISAFIDIHGNITTQLPMFEKSTTATLIYPSSGLSVYAKWGDNIWIYLTILIILILLMLAKFKTYLFKIDLSKSDQSKTHNN